MTFSRFVARAKVKAVWAELKVTESRAKRNGRAVTSVISKLD